MKKARSLPIYALSAKICAMSSKATIVIETSTPRGSIGRWNGTWKEIDFTSDRSHNCDIFPHLQELLADTDRGSIERIIVGTGPGSYSGTRVGIAVAQGLAIAHSASLVGLPSILAVPSARDLPRSRAIGDARRGDWWWCDIHQGAFPATPQLTRKAELATLLQEDCPIFSLDLVAEEAFARKIPQETPNATRLWQAWLALDEKQRMAACAMTVQPMYLKPPHITTAKKRDTAVPPDFKSQPE